MHSDKLRIILDSWEGALDIVVACVTIMVRIRYCQVQFPDAKAMERCGKMELGLVFLVGPIVDSEGARERTETAAG